MEAGVVLLILGLGLLSGSALLAFSWAARDRQLDDLEAGARVIFDADEIEDAGAPGGRENSGDESVAAPVPGDPGAIGVKPSAVQREDGSR